MAKCGTLRGTGTSASSAGSARTSRTTSVSMTRLQQKSGTRNSFGGYTKVNNGDGTFRMRKTGK